jgi:four helix bundle protein
MTKIASHRDLLVWQKAMDLVVAIYDVTVDFPSNEKYGLVTQMQKAAVSIPSNIAEGKRRGTRKDYRHFLHMAYGSGAELETQCEIVRRLKFGKPENLLKAESVLLEVMKMLNVLIDRLGAAPTSYNPQPTT